MRSSETAARRLPVMKRLRSDERAESHAHTRTHRHRPQRERECETADCQSESLQIESRRRWTQQPTVTQPQLMVTDHLRHLLLLHLLAAVVVVFPTAQLSSRRRHQLLLNLVLQILFPVRFFSLFLISSPPLSLSLLYSLLSRPFLPSFLPIDVFSFVSSALSRSRLFWPFMNQQINGSTHLGGQRSKVRVEFSTVYFK